VKQTDILQKAVGKLEKHKEEKHLVVGFDGFIDEIIHVVDQRKNSKEYKRIKDIKAFSERIASVAGLSANIELVPTQVKLGGNGPIMANALITQGQQITYIGAIGKHFIHPLFRPFSENCRKVISLAEPGHTDALEFYDGKLMFGKIHTMNEVSIENLLKKISEKELTEILGVTDMVAFTNWTMLENLNGVMDYFGKVIGSQKKKTSVFIDLADPKKRTTKDIEKILELISGYPCNTILSMNMSESTIISTVLGIKETEVLPRAMQIRENMGITGIVIHPVQGAAIAHEKESVWIDGPYTKKPALSTGAGDNFNAGFCNAWLGGFSPGECIITGVCTSGFYVRNAKSPTRTELLGFMEQWLAADCGSI